MTTFEHRSGLPVSRAVSANHGWLWYIRAFQLFRQQPGLWIVFTLIFFIIHIVATKLPLIGMVANLLGPILFAGIVTACSMAENGEELEIGQLFAGFRQRTDQLALLGVVAVVAMMAVSMIAFLPVLVAGGATVFTGILIGNMEALAGIGLFAALAIVISILVFAAMAIPVTMALWFATNLVMLEGVGAVDALKLGLNASLRNLVPMLVYTVIGTVLMFVAIIPFGLGLLVLGPTLLITGYVSYRDVFDR
ncbi:BPSS1780 family membrane protein [Chitinivorax sp. B]|uniref:BPSS1780 family membrane protein n=1 Tax=Chitinivorax sp. B TaxID=2502235 RepID=UPI0010F583EF|nr:BPSS1780 family membrane protein [Chitinivorax sp. B]